MRNPCKLQTGPCQSFTQIKTSGISFHIRSQRDYDLFNRFGGQAFFEFHNAQIFGLNTVERRNFAAENMIFAAVGTGFFNAENIHRLLDNTHKGAVAARIVADIAR